MSEFNNLKIGETAVFNGEDVIVLESNIFDCGDCVCYNNGNCCPRELGNCQRLFRNDKKDVVFVAKNTTKEFFLNNKRDIKITIGGW